MRGTADDVIAGRATWAILAGDCAVRVREIPDALQGEVNTAPLDVHMARVTERDHVLHGVRVVWILERGHGRNVVDVVKLPRRGRGGAPPAFVAVTIARRSPNGAPVGAVVPRVTASPCRVLIALAKGVAAVERAELEAARSRPPVAWIVKGLRAICARGRVERPLPPWLRGRGDHRGLPGFGVGVRLRHDAPCHSDRPAGVVARSGAERRSVVAPRDLRRMFLDFDAARSARDTDHGFALLRRESGIMTGAGAEAGGLVLHARGSKLERFGARLTYALDHCLHPAKLASFAFMGNAWGTK